MYMGTRLQRRRITNLITIFALLARLALARAQDDPTAEPAPDPALPLPFADPPGPSTWVYEQHYGNTTPPSITGASGTLPGRGCTSG